MKKEEKISYDDIIKGNISNENLKAIILKKKINNQYCELFNHLIRCKKIDVIKFILNEFIYYINDKIINIYLLGCYKNRRCLSDENINQIQNELQIFKFVKNSYNKNNPEVIDFDYNFTDFDYIFTDYILNANKWNKKYKKVINILFKFVFDYKIAININELILPAINKSNVNLVNLLIKYSYTFNIKLITVNDRIFRPIINNKDEYSCIKIYKPIIKYSLDHHIYININRCCFGDKDLLEIAIKFNDINMVRLLTNYCKEFNIVLNIDEHSVYLAIKNNNWEMATILLQYLCESDIELSQKILLNIINNGDIKNIKIEIIKIENLLYKAFRTSNSEIVKLLIDYAMKHEILLNYHGENNLLWKEVFNSCNFEIIEMFINYAQHHNILSNDKNNKDSKRKRIDFPMKIINNNKCVSLLKSLINFSNNYDFILNIKKKNKGGTFSLLAALNNNNTDFVKLLIDYANDHEIILNFNKFLIIPIENNNFDIIKLLIEYSIDHGIPLNIRYNILLKAFKNNNIDIIKLLFNYINDQNIKIDTYNCSYNNILFEDIKNNNEEALEIFLEYTSKYGIPIDLNVKGNKNSCPIINAIKNNDYGIVKLLIKYAKQRGVILQINNTDKNNERGLIIALKNNHTDIIKSVIDYANDCNIKLNINEKVAHEVNGTFYPLIIAVFNNNMEAVKLIMDYANHHQVTLEINERGYFGGFPILKAVKNNNFDMVKLLIDYANDHHLILNINEKYKFEYPLMNSICLDNVDMVRLLIEYANDHKILLKMNDIDFYGRYPLVMALSNNNIAIVKLLFEYANVHNFTLNMIRKDYHEYLKQITEIKKEISSIKINLLQ